MASQASDGKRRGLKEDPLVKDLNGLEINKMKKERNQRKKKNVNSGNQPKVNQQCQKMKNPVKNEDANVFGMHIYSDDINANGTIDLNEVSKKTKILGLDCEMVGAGSKGQMSILARVSIVDQFGQVLYDTFVTTKRKVTDYRTAISGVRPCHLQGAPHFWKVQAQVARLIKDSILVGHSITNDLRVLYLDHPKEMIRDTAKYKPFKAAFSGRTPSLKSLAAKFLGMSIQAGEHSSVEDSQAAVRLYIMFMDEWEVGKKCSSTDNKIVKGKVKELPTNPMFNDPNSANMTNLQLLDSHLREITMTEVKVNSPEKAPKSTVKNSISESEKPDKKVKSIPEPDTTEKKMSSQLQNKNVKNGPKTEKHDKLDDASVEKEFLAFIAKLKSKYPGNGLAYQRNYFPGGMECTFHLARLPAGESSTFTASFSQPVHNEKKEMKELTEEQKVKLAAQKEKLRERRREAKLRKRAEKQNENPRKPSENGDAMQHAVKDDNKVQEDKEEKVVPNEVKKVEKAVIKEGT